MEMDLDGDLLKQLETEEEELFPPVTTDADLNLQKSLLICGLPIITADKEEKLLGLLRSLIVRFTVEPTGESPVITKMEMPFDTATGKSKGFLFVTFQKASHATLIQQMMHDKPFAGKNIFKIYRSDSWETLNQSPDQFVERPEKPFPLPDPLQSWLYSQESLDGMDEFVIRFDSTSEVFWHSNGTVIPEIRKSWTTENINFEWSPRGTYLVNFAPLGVSLIGGPTWTKQRGFKHQFVQRVQFSPCEKYLFTWSPKLQENETPENPQSIVLWDIKLGRALRSFPTLSGNWPAFCWSHNDKYFSRLNQGLIYVYETETLSLLKDASGEKKPIRLHGPTFNHAWSPTDPYLAVFVPGRSDLPARVILMEMPMRRTLGQVSMVNVIGCYIHWQEPKGDFLAVRVDRHGKSKKQTFTAFEFFRVRDKNIPVESLELKDFVIAFDWEPCGNRFAIIHAETTSSTRVSVSFYSMEGGKLKLLRTLEKKQANHLFWSPSGRYIVLAGLRSMNHQLEFFDVDNLESFTLTQHSLCTDLAWDPSGRYFTSFVSYLRCKNENGFKIWNHRGVELLSVNKDTLYQFLWRPRPPTSLPPEKIQWLKVPKNFQEFQRKYKELDQVQDTERTEKERAHREELRRAYRRAQAERMLQWKRDAEWRRSLGIVDEDEEDFYIVEECVAEVLSVEEQILE